MEPGHETRCEDKRSRRAQPGKAGIRIPSPVTTRISEYSLVSDLFYKHDIYRVCLSFCIKRICEICCFAILFPAWLERALPRCMERSQQAPGDHHMEPGHETRCEDIRSRRAQPGKAGIRIPYPVTTRIHEYFFSI